MKLVAMLAAACLITLGAEALFAQTSATLKIDTATPISTVSPTLYGLMTEEINYSYDGGLYPEMVKNRTFRDGGWMQQDWIVVANASGGATFEHDKSTGPSQALTDSIKLTVSSATAEE